MKTTTHSHILPSSSLTTGRRWQKNRLCQAITLAAACWQASPLFAAVWVCPNTVSDGQSLTAGCMINAEDSTLIIKSGGVINGITANTATPSELAAVVINATHATLDNHGLIKASDLQSGDVVAGIHVTSDFAGNITNHSNGTIHIPETAGELAAGGIYMPNGLQTGAAVINDGTITATNLDGLFAFGIGDFFDSNGILIEGNIENHGDIYVKANDVAAGISFFAGLGTAGNVINTGSITANVTDTGGSGLVPALAWARGIAVSDINGTIENHGTVTVNSTLSDTQDIFAHAEGIVLVNLFSSGSFTNTGTVHVTARAATSSQLASAAGIDILATASQSIDGTIINRGLIWANNGMEELTTPLDNHIARSVRIGNINSATGLLHNEASGLLIGGMLIDDTASALEFLNLGLVRANVGQIVELHNGAKYTQTGDNGHAGIEIEGVGLDEYFGSWDVQGSGLHLANDQLDVFVKTLELGDHTIENIIAADDGVTSESDDNLDALQTYNPNPFWTASAEINPDTDNVDLYLTSTREYTHAAGEVWRNGPTTEVAIYMPSTTLPDNDQPSLLHLYGEVIGQIKMYDGRVDIYGDQASVSGLVFGIEESLVNVLDDADFRTDNEFEVDQFNIQSGGKLRQHHDISVGTGNGVGSGHFANHGTHIQHSGADILGDYRNRGKHTQYSSATVIGDYKNYGLHILQGGEVTVDGDYYNEGTIEIDVANNSTVSYDQLIVTGDADLRQGQLEVILTGELQPSDDQRLTGVVQAGDKLRLTNDTIDVIDDNVYLLSFVAERNPNNDNWLDLIYEQDGSIAEATCQQYPYACPVAELFDEQVSNPTDEMLPIVQLWYQMDPTELARMAAQNVPVIIGQSAQALVLNITRTLDAILHRLGGHHNQPHGQSSGNDVIQERNIWVKLMGNRAELDGRNKVPGYDVKSYGIAIGADTAPQNSPWRVGTAFAYSHIEIDGDTINKNEVDVDSWQIALYGQYTPNDQMFLDLVAIGGFNTNDSERRITFQGFDATAKGDYDGEYARLYAGAGHHFDLHPGITLTPVVSLSYTVLDEDRYQETGAGALNLDVRSNDDDSLILAIDGVVSFDLMHNTQLAVYAGGGYDFLTDRSIVDYSVVGIPGTVLSVTANKPHDWVYRGGIGLEATAMENLEVFVNYDYQGRKDFNNHLVSAAAQWAF